MCMMILTPLLSFHVAQAKIVPDCGTLSVVPGSNPPKKEILNPCNFEYLMQLVNNIIEFLLFIIAAPLVAIILCYAGFIMLTSGGSAEKVTKAKHIIKSVVFGYIIALAAWLVIHTIMTTLGFNGPSLLKG